jgi:hypothetical protein
MPIPAMKTKAERSRLLILFASFDIFLVLFEGFGEQMALRAVFFGDIK